MTKIGWSALFIGVLLLAGAGCGFLTDTKKTALCEMGSCIKLLTPASFTPGATSTLQFNITDAEGAVMKNFAVAHEKLLHLIIVRSDLQEFQHQHPEYDAHTGVFSLENFQLPTPGAYKMYADFTLTSDIRALPTVSSIDLTAGSPENAPLTAVEPTKNTQSVDGYTIDLIFDPLMATSGRENVAAFSISRDGKPVTDLQQYLGALGHLVMIRENTLEYIHVHPVTEVAAPQTGTITFATSLPGGGNYALFLQFRHQNKILTSRFVIPIQQNSLMDEIPEHHMQH